LGFHISWYIINLLDNFNEEIDFLISEHYREQSDSDEWLNGETVVEVQGKIDTSQKNGSTEISPAEEAVEQPIVFNL
jgi:hypothetical protein